LTADVATIATTGALWLAIEIIDYLFHAAARKEPAFNEQVAVVVFALSILGPLGANLAHLLNQRPPLARRGACYGRAAFRRSPGSLAMVAAMRRASSQVRRCAAE
jgi:hypothetical protein